GRSCHLKAEALGDKLTLLVDGHPVLEAQDSTLRYGLVGLYHGAAGRSEWSGFHSAGKPG
ncbi:MAG: hypothetical protein RR216_04270, partial [Pseudoflavonifractor sp.]